MWPHDVIFYRMDRREMPSQRERFETWLARRKPREPQWEAELLKVADAYDAVKVSGKLTPEDLRVVVDGASHSRALVWENSIQLLGWLSEKYPDAASAIAEMFKSRKSHVRFNAVCCLTPGTKGNVPELLRAGMADKSSRVRWKAAEKTQELNLRELVPEMTAALKAETNQRVLKSIEMSLGLLRDGYVFKWTQSLGYQITVPIHKGVYKGICGRSVTKKELDERGIEAIAEDLRKQKTTG
jgi:hypothetical protein